MMNFGNTEGGRIIFSASFSSEEFDFLKGAFFYGNILSNSFFTGREISQGFNFFRSVYLRGEDLLRRVLGGGDVILVGGFSNLFNFSRGKIFFRIFTFVGDGGGFNIFIIFPLEGRFHSSPFFHFFGRQLFLFFCKKK